ncbi:hypothetical protein JOB18_035525 [Solea senegalensis]|uniref:Uncharacterized protein n=1 Tax=Solea senegalensis TaxID=28829 RepID=A0AAV6R8J8_SOLSE|nr:hypothetical protein JOB18_035525 [Solea senegalensis]
MFVLWTDMNEIKTTYFRDKVHFREESALNAATLCISECRVEHVNAAPLPGTAAALCSVCVGDGRQQARCIAQLCLYNASSAARCVCVCVEKHTEVLHQHKTVNCICKALFIEPTRVC